MKTVSDTYFETENLPSNQVLMRVRERIVELERQGVIEFPSLSASVFKDHRWRTPYRRRKLRKNSAVGERICKLLKILEAGKLRNTTIRDIWYIALAEPYSLYSEGSSTNPFKNQLSGNDIPLLEAILGVDRETFGIRAGFRGFLFGPPGWHLASSLRGWVELSTMPALIHDLGADTTTISDEIEKILVLEKESFVPHLVPEDRYGFDFRFLQVLNTMIITSKGYEVKYLKQFIHNQANQGKRILSFHDADWDGFAMAFILRHHSKASSHLPDGLLVEPVEMGLFATVCKKLGLIPERIRASQRQREEYVKFMADAVEAPGWLQEEIDLVDAEQKRYELQALSGIHEKAGQSYLLELFRQYEIPLKELPDKKELKKRMLRDFSVKLIKDLLHNEIEYAISNLIEEIREKVEEAVLDQVDIDDLVEDAVKDIEHLRHDRFDPDVLEHNLRDIYASRGLTWDTDALLNALSRRLGNIETEAELEYDLDKPLTEMVSDVKVSATRIIRDLEDVEPADPYDAAIKYLMLPDDVCVKFRYAFRDKFGAGEQ